jgi:hypothetical protein
MHQIFWGRKIQQNYTILLCILFLIFQKSAESEELTEKLDIYIRQMITSPENYFKVIYFLNFSSYNIFIASFTTKSSW